MCVCTSSRWSIAKSNTIVLQYWLGKKYCNQYCNTIAISIAILFPPSIAIALLFASIANNPAEMLFIVVLVWESFLPNCSDQWRVWAASSVAGRSSCRPREYLDLNDNRTSTANLAINPLTYHHLLVPLWTLSNWRYINWRIHSFIHSFIHYVNTDDNDNIIHIYLET